MLICNDVQLDFDDVLIRPQVNCNNINSRKDVEIIRKYKGLNIEGCPIIQANMTQTGIFKIAEILLKNQMFATLHKFYKANEIIEFINTLPLEINISNLFITIGLRNYEEEINKLKEIKNNLPKERQNFSILIDVPNAYIPAIDNLVKLVHQNFSKNILGVGNVVTAERTQELIKLGAKFVKVGIGTSKICDTRIKTGVGRPQLSAIIDCANAAHQLDGFVIADGGLKTVGDISKALIAGADICMSGSMFAGCEEAAGDTIEKMIQLNEFEPEFYYDESCGGYAAEYSKLKRQLKVFKDYYGMSSLRAQKENYNQITEFGTSEGVESSLVPYVGKVEKVIKDIKGGLRSCGTYIGAKNVKYFPRQGIFYKVNRIK